MQVPKEEQIVIAGQHEPLVDKEIFDIVQQMIDSRQKNKKTQIRFFTKRFIRVCRMWKKV